MRTARPKSLLERSADADLWLRTLSQIPVLIGRLVYLAALKSPVTGRYEHHGLAMQYGDADSDKAIRLSHRKTFQEWLGLGLAEKVDDLRGYFQSTGEDGAELLRHWSKGDAWAGFVPMGALAAEKSLYSNDMRNAVKILQLQYGGASRGQSA